MSFAGHVFDMIARMKANAQRKRDPFDREVQASGPAIRPEYLREASEEELAYLRDKTLRDQRIQHRRTRIAFVLLVLVIVCVVLLLQWNAAA
jgi:CHASE3 domain sensor protein